MEEGARFSCLPLPESCHGQVEPDCACVLRAMDYTSWQQKLLAQCAAHNQQQNDANRGWWISISSASDAALMTALETGCFVGPTELLNVKHGQKIFFGTPTKGGHALIRVCSAITDGMTVSSTTSEVLLRDLSGEHEQHEFGAWLFGTHSSAVLGLADWQVDVLESAQRERESRADHDYALHLSGLSPQPTTPTAQSWSGLFKTPLGGQPQQPAMRAAPARLASSRSAHPIPGSAPPGPRRQGRAREQTAQGGEPPGHAARRLDFTDPGKSTARMSKAVVVIDGMNVMSSEKVGYRSPGIDYKQWHAANGDKPPLCARAVMDAIEHFRSQGHVVVAVIPQHRMDGGANGLGQAFEVELLQPFLEGLVPGASVQCCPSRTDDDHFVIRYAKSCGGIILTNDHLERHVKAGTISSEWRNLHVLKYMFASKPPLSTKENGSPSWASTNLLLPEREATLPALQPVRAAEANGQQAYRRQRVEA